jgi:FdhD protein
MMNANQPIEIIVIESNHWIKHRAEIIVETPVSLTVNGDLWLTFMCTPVDLESLAVGFLYNEGIIQAKSEIADVRLCPTGDNIDVWLNHAVEKPGSWRKTSGCTGGITSVAVEDPEESLFTNKSNNGFGITPNQVGELISKLFASQDLYQKSGGVHTSALSNGNDIVLATEDIGRHNTLDKIAGKCLLEEIQLDHRLLLTTGRISSEMLQKANRIGASILISRTSPSSLSIHLAEKFGITLIGYARRDRFKLYSHPERIFSLSGFQEIAMDAKSQAKAEVETK